MPGVGGAHGRFHSIGIADLADKNDVGVLPKRGPQRIGELVRVRPDFALGDNAFIVAVQIFNRVLDRYNVDRCVIVHMVDHRRQQSRFSAPRRSGHQNEPPFLHGDIEDDHRKVQLAERRDFRADGAYRERGGPALAKRVDPEPPDAFKPDGEIQFVFFLEDPGLLLAHKGGEDLIDVLHCKRFHLRAEKRAVYAKHRRRTRAQMNIRGAFVHHHFKQCVDIDHTSSSIR